MADRSRAQTLTMLFGLTFVVVGILGFVPGIVTNYDDLAFVGEDSTAELLGLVGGGDWIPANDADHWLHLALGLALLGSWFISRSNVSVRDRAAAAA